MKTIKKGYLRVTAMLYPFSGMKEVPQHYLDNASERGSRVHEAILALEQGIGLAELDKNYKGYLASYELWAPGKNFLPVPDRFYDDELMITGEIDGIMKDGDDLVIVDYKTSAKENKSWALQASAYSYMAKKSGYDIKRIQFIKLDKEGNEPITFEYTEDMETFKKVLFTYRLFFKDKDEENPMDYI